jgi:hypothetical protein
MPSKATYYETPFHFVEFQQGPQIARNIGAWSAASLRKVFVRFRYSAALLSSPACLSASLFSSLFLNSVSPRVESLSSLSPSRSRSFSFPFSFSFVSGGFSTAPPWKSPLPFISSNASSPSEHISPSESDSAVRYFPPQPLSTCTQTRHDTWDQRNGLGENRDRGKSDHTVALGLLNSLTLRCSRIVPFSLNVLNSSFSGGAPKIAVCISWSTLFSVRKKVHEICLSWSDLLQQLEPWLATRLFTTQFYTSHMCCASRSGKKTRNLLHSEPFSFWAVSRWASYHGLLAVL